MYTNVPMGRGETLGPTGSGATSAWCGRCGVPGGVPGCSRERSGTPPGAFGRAFGGENLSSEQKDSSTMSTNAVISNASSPRVGAGGLWPVNPPTLARRVGAFPGLEEAKRSR